MIRLSARKSANSCMRRGRYKTCIKRMQVSVPLFLYADSVQARLTAAEHMNLLVVVLRAPDEPILSRMQVHRLAKAQRAHKEYLKQRASQEDSDDDDGPQNEDAWLLEDLKVLTQLYSKLRDREQLIALIFEVSRNALGLLLMSRIKWISFE